MDMTGPKNTVPSLLPDLKKAFAMKELRPLQPGEVEKASGILKDLGHDARYVEEFLSAYQKAMSLE